jgi:hypothetical protein
LHVYASPRRDLRVNMAQVLHCFERFCIALTTLSCVYIEYPRKRKLSSDRKQSVKFDFCKLKSQSIISCLLVKILWVLMILVGLALDEWTRALKIHLRIKGLQIVCCVCQRFASICGEYAEADIIGRLKASLCGIGFIHCKWARTVNHVLTRPKRSLGFKAQASKPTTWWSLSKPWVCSS